MTIKPSGTSLSINEIDAEFGLGKSLSSYRGVTWYTDAGATGTFSSTNLRFSDFYSKRKDAPAIYVQYLLVGGGGGGGVATHDNRGGGAGGGGGGGLVMWDANLNTGTSYTITIGAGGAGGYWDNTLGYVRGTAGGSTTISGPIGSTYAGGGQPGRALLYGLYIQEPSNAYYGGQGGTGIYAPSGSSTPGYIAYGVGNDGGGYVNGIGQQGNSDGKRAGGGGGGTDDVAATGTIGKGGDGGVWLDGVTYGGGGGGGADFNQGGAGGAGGGGTGGSSVLATSGTNGYGGGGGGGGSNVNWPLTGGNGGKGVAILRYAGSTAKATGGTISYAGGYVYHKFTSDGTFTIN